MLALFHTRLGASQSAVEYVVLLDPPTLEPPSELEVALPADVRLVLANVPPVGPIPVVEDLPPVVALAPVHGLPPVGMGPSVDP